MNFDELPGIPGIWLDFVHSRLPISAATRDLCSLAVPVEVLRRQAVWSADFCRFLESNQSLLPERALSKARRILQPRSVVVLADLSPELLGGSARQILKCLTVIKVCERLARRNLEAVPVCWMHDSVSGDSALHSIQLLDGESEIRHLKLGSVEEQDFGPCTILAETQILQLFEQILETGRDTSDPDTLEIIRASYRPDTTLAQASARLISTLMEEWGLIVINQSSSGFQSFLRDKAAGVSGATLPKRAIHNLLFPVALCVLAPNEVQAFVEDRAACETFQLLPPQAWPQASATIIELRHRRILERYGLKLNQLFLGKSAIIGSLQAAMPIKALEKLSELNRETHDRVAGLSFPVSAGMDFDNATAALANKIGYQLSRLQQKLESAHKNSQETIARRLHRVCNALTPNGRLQEVELAGIQWPLRYTRAVLHSLYEHLDVEGFEHQLIFMD